MTPEERRERKRTYDAERYARLAGRPKMPDEPLHVISLGAGVQSSTLALMAAHGLIGPMPVAAVFADTGWESQRTYRWLEWLKKRLPFPVHVVSAGNIRDDQLANVERHRTLMPFYTRGQGGGKNAILRRKCTHMYKVRPIQEFMRRHLLGLRPKQWAPKHVVIVQWFGISTDEAYRMRDSREPWIQHRYPLIELGMSRDDCETWLRHHGYPVPARSVCIGCPFQSDAEWRQLRDERPNEWQDAVEFDRAVRRAGGPKGDVYLHWSLRPLELVDFTPAASQLDLFANECEGLCGT